VHGVAFEPTATCEACDEDPGAPIEPPIEAIPAAPEGCESTLELERGMLATARELDVQRRTLSKAKVKDLHLYNTVSKLAEVALKYRRAVVEVATRREDAQIQAERERRDRERQRGGH
jgi:hypothetical protein